MCFAEVTLQDLPRNALIFVEMKCPTTSLVTSVTPPTGSSHNYQEISYPERISKCIPDVHARASTFSRMSYIKIKEEEKRRGEFYTLPRHNLP